MKKPTSRRPAPWLVILPLLIAFFVTLVGAAPAAQSRSSRNLAAAAEGGREESAPGLAARQRRVSGCSLRHKRLRLPGAAASTPRTAESASSSKHRMAPAPRQHRRWRAAPSSPRPAASSRRSSRRPGSMRCRARAASTYVRAPLHAVRSGPRAREWPRPLRVPGTPPARPASGAKVAVIDLGFAGYAARQAAGELPAVTQVRLLRRQHGRSRAARHRRRRDRPRDGAGRAALSDLHRHRGRPHERRGLREGERDHDRQPLRRLVQHLPRRRHRRAALRTAIVADARANGILWVNSAGNRRRALERRVLGFEW